MINIKKWACPKRLKYSLFFQDLNCDELNITLDKYVRTCPFNLSKLRDNYSKLFGDNIQVTNGDYYDSDEFKKLTKILPKNVFFHIAY